MPRNGSGQYSLPYNWNDDKNNGIKVLSSRMQVQDQDIANALTASIAADGQTSLTGDLDFNNNLCLNLGEGSDFGDSISLGQIKYRGISFLGIANTANQINYSLSPAPNIDDYTNGLKFEFEVSSACLANPTLKINDILVASNPLNFVKINNSGGVTNCIANDLLPNRIYQAGYYDASGTTKILVFNPEIPYLTSEEISSKRLSTPIGTTQTIASGIITASASNFLIDTEGAATTDDLDTINGGVSGMFLTVGSVSNARNVILKHNTGNIFNPAGVDIVLDVTTDKIQLLYSTTLSKWVVTSSKSLTPMAIFEDQKASGTDGGTFTSGAWQTRPLNTSVVNNISGCSLSGNQITLEAGTYKGFIMGVALDVNQHQIKLRNISDSTDAILGINNNTTTGSDISTTALAFGQFTINSQKIFEVQHRCSITQLTNGFGSAASFGIEKYCQLKLTKIA